MLTEGDQARIWASGTKDRMAWECIAQVSPLLFSHRRADVLKGQALAERALTARPRHGSRASRGDGGSAWEWNPPVPLSTEPNRL